MDIINIIVTLSIICILVLFYRIYPKGSAIEEKFRKAKQSKKSRTLIEDDKKRESNNHHNF